MKHCLLHHVTHVPAKFEVARPIVKELHYQENTLYDLDPKVKGVKVTQNVAQYPQHHVTYSMHQQSLILLHSTFKENFLFV